MSTQHNSHFDRSATGASLLRGALTAAVVVLAVLACRGWSAERGPKPGSSKAPTETLVRMALESELAGRAKERGTLLRKALEQSPNDAQAHWQSGQIRVDGNWLSPDEVAQTARQDKRLSRYRQRRDAAAATTDDQAALARWCRRNKLNDEQRVQWLQVLAIQPDNAEAIQALDLRVYQGMLRTPAEIAQLKAQIRDMHQTMQHWTPVVTQWREALKSGDETARAKVVEEIRAVRDPGKLMALELAIPRRLGGKKTDRPAYQQVSEDMVATLKGMPGPSAAESLARFAVFSPFKSVKSAACAALKQRPLDHFAPLMLSWMATPIEADFRVVRDVEGHPIMQQSFFREGPLVNVSYTVLRSSVASPIDPVVFGSRLADADTVQRLAAARAQGKSAELHAERGFAAEAATRQRAVDELNAAITEQNVRVAQALARSAGVDLGPEPTQYWDWWLKYNDWYDQQGEKPTVPYVEQHVFVPGQHSCFAQGTKVWTLTGPVAIEQVKPGDRVLSQDVDTGELQYKPVVTTTVNPTGRMMKINLGKESITCTPGHPAWVVGEGWRLARQLAAGQRLHTLSGGAAIESVEKVKPGDPSSEFAFNLIVADFSTYFVGEQGILVHDNTPRKPTPALLPGFLDFASPTTSYNREGEARLPAE